jgi:hypothetical protein
MNPTLRIRKPRLSVISVTETIASTVVTAAFQGPQPSAPAIAK